MRQDTNRRYNEAASVPTRTVMQHPTNPYLFFPVHRRPMRLPRVDYASPTCLCFVTFNVKSVNGVLLTGEIAAIAWSTLRERLTGCALHAACMMPDHVHLLIAPSGAGETISDIVCRLKSCICLAIRNETHQYLKWKTSFYDHVLLAAEPWEEEAAAIVHYIRANPNRAGLGED